MSSPTYEYIIKQKNEGGVLAKKLALIFGYFVLFGGLAIIILKLSAPLFMIPFLIVDLLFCAMVAFITWRFVSVEYEIIIGTGEISATVIYGKSIRRLMFSVPINSLSQAGIYNDEAYERLSEMSLQKNYLCVSSLSAPVLYYAIFDEGKERCVLYFEAGDEAIKYLRQKNASAFRAGNYKDGSKT